MSLAEPFLQEASTTHCGWVCAAQLDSHRFNSQFTSMREAARPEYLKPDSFDLSNYVQGYDSKKHFMERPSLAISLVHIQEDEPENAYRDAADVAEFIEKYTSYFLTPEDTLVPFLSIEKDNAHGPASLACQFAFTLLALLYDFDYVNIGSQEATMSLLHQVEGVQGGLARRINGRAFTLPALAPDGASAALKRAAMEGVRTAICERANGAGFGGSFIAVHPARSTLLRSGFVWRPAELAAFVDAARKGQAQTFVATTLKHMDGFASYGALLIRAWTCCNVTGSLACTKATAHSWQYRKNASNLQCMPWRGPTAFRDLLDLFGGFKPQAKQSLDRPGHYMRLPERIRFENRSPTLIDEFYPKKMIDDILEAGVDVVSMHAEGTLPSEMFGDLTKVLMVSELELKYDLSERAAKVQHAAEYKAISEKQKTSGHLDRATAIVKALLTKPTRCARCIKALATTCAHSLAGWPYVPDFKAALEILKLKPPATDVRKATLVAIIMDGWPKLDEGLRQSIQARMQAVQARMAPAPAAPAPPAPEANAPVARVIASVVATAVPPVTPVSPVTLAGMVTPAAALTAPPPPAAPMVAPPQPIVSPASELDQLMTLEAALPICSGCDPLDEEEALEAEVEEAEAEQARLAAVVDSLIVREYICERHCGAKLPREEMQETPHHWYCRDEHACSERLNKMTRENAARKRSRPAWLDE